MDKRNWADKTAGVVGGGIGGAIGLLGGPIGAILGGAAGSAITDTLKDVIKRTASNREKIRIDNASTYVISGLLERLNSGEIVRQDGFFAGDANFTSDGAELLDGILMKCKEQYQERKVHFISNIFKNIAFGITITARAAHQTLSLAEELTYQKLCLLAYYGNRENFSSFNIMRDPTLWYPHVEFSEEMEICLQDLLEMLNQGVLSNEVMGTDSNSVMAGGMKLTAKGQRAFKLMELDQVAREDILDALQPLEFQDSWGMSKNRTINGVRQPFTPTTPT
jgi:hypothetical protein